MNWNIPDTEDILEQIQQAQEQAERAAEQYRETNDLRKEVARLKRQIALSPKSTIVDKYLTAKEKAEQTIMDSVGLGVVSEKTSRIGVTALAILLVAYLVGRVE
jgi:hypothetical protein|tara:strand:+ start:296 stop:607 length:312 start_codon:yes stop_codon:yes gene_type:complete